MEGGTFMGKAAKLFVGATIGLSLVLPLLHNVSNNSNAMLETNASGIGTYTTDAETFYGSDNGFTNHVTSTDTGTTLLTNVHNLENEAHRYYNSYDDLKTALLSTDEDPDEPENIVLMYSNTSVKAKWNSIVWNREHVWCQSLGGWSTGLGPGSDVLHLRPVNYTLNSTRNNNPYGAVATHDSTTQFDITDCWLSGGVFEPGDRIKGDVARELMYVYSHYDNTTGNTPTYGYTLSITNIVSTSAATATAAWALLNEWSALDPIDYAEMQRNNIGSSLTGTRNAFVDHPEYGEAIWGSGNGLSLSSSNFKITTSGSKTLTASAQGSGSLGTVTWSSSDATIASVSNGVVTGHKNGVAYITASSTIGSTTYTSRSIAIVGTGWQAKGLGINGTIIDPLTSSTAEAVDTTTQDSVTFSQSGGSFQQLVSGNSFTMTVANFNKNVTSVNLFMHSNKSAGAMSVSITVGGTSIENETMQTFAHYYKQNYLTTADERFCMTFIDLKFANNTTTKTGDVVITVTGTTNSVYYDRITIAYESSTEGRTDAVNWATSFTNGTQTECAALNVTTSTWSTYSGTYSALSTAAKNYFYNNANNTSETEIYAAAKRYLFIVNKYGYTAFITDGNGNILSDNYLTNNYNSDENQLINNNDIITIILSLGIVIVLSIGGIYFASKRRRNLE